MPHLILVALSSISTMNECIILILQCQRVNGMFLLDLWSLLQEMGGPFLGEGLTELSCSHGITPKFSMLRQYLLLPCYLAILFGFWNCLLRLSFSGHRSSSGSESYLPSNKHSFHNHSSPKHSPRKRFIISQSRYTPGAPFLPPFGVPCGSQWDHFNWWWYFDRRSNTRPKVWQRFNTPLLLLRLLLLLLCICMC